MFSCTKHFRLFLRFVNSFTAAHCWRGETAKCLFIFRYEALPHNITMQNPIFPNDGVQPSSFPLPPPPLYCISQASPIMVSILHQATNGHPPSPLRTMAPWAPRRLSCCKASMPHRPATPLSSTWPARISIRAQVCTRLSFIQWLIWFMRLTHHPAIHLNKRQSEGKGPVHPRGLLDVRCMFVTLMKAFSSCLLIR